MKLSVVDVHEISNHYSNFYNNVSSYNPENENQKELDAFENLYRNGDVIGLKNFLFDGINGIRKDLGDEDITKKTSANILMARYMMYCDKVKEKIASGDNGYSQNDIDEVKSAIADKLDMKDYYLQILEKIPANPSQNVLRTACDMVVEDRFGKLNYEAMHQFGIKFDSAEAEQNGVFIKSFEDIAKEQLDKKQKQILNRKVTMFENMTLLRKDATQKKLKLDSNLFLKIFEKRNETHFNGYSGRGNEVADVMNRFNAFEAKAQEASNMAGAIDGWSMQQKLSQQGKDVMNRIMPEAKDKAAQALADKLCFYREYKAKIEGRHKNPIARFFSNIIHFRRNRAEKNNLNNMLNNIKNTYELSDENINNIFNASSSERNATSYGFLSREDNSYTLSVGDVNGINAKANELRTQYEERTKGKFNTILPDDSVLQDDKPEMKTSKILSSDDLHNSIIADVNDSKVANTSKSQKSKGKRLENQISIDELN